MCHVVKYVCVCLCGFPGCFSLFFFSVWSLFFLVSLLCSLFLDFCFVLARRREGESCRRRSGRSCCAGAAAGDAADAPARALARAVAERHTTWACNRHTCTSSTSVVYYPRHVFFPTSNTCSTSFTHATHYVEHMSTLASPLHLHGLQPPRRELAQAPRRDGKVLVTISQVKLSTTTLLQDFGSALVFLLSRLLRK